MTRILINSDGHRVRAEHLIIRLYFTRRNAFRIIWVSLGEYTSDSTEGAASYEIAGE